MAYTKTDWVNGQSPDLAQSNLNKIEDGIFTNDALVSLHTIDISENVTAIGTNTSDITTLQGTKEDSLGNPDTDGKILTSTKLGIRSWVNPGSAPVDSVNSKTGTVILSTLDILENTNLYYTEVRTDARVQAAINDSASSSTELYSSTKIESLFSGTSSYKGTWDAATNTPTLIDGTGSAGEFYKVSVSGTQDLGSGSISYVAGDSVNYNGTIWEEVSSYQAVDSVNGEVGTVVLDKTDISLGNVDNTTDLLKPISTDTQTALNLKSNTDHNHAGVYEPANANIVTNTSYAQPTVSGVIKVRLDGTDAYISTTVTNP